MPPEDEIEFPPGYPEEAKQAIRAEVARRSMEMQSSQLTLKRFLDETLDQDGAIIMKNIMGRIEQEPPLASYWHGYLARLIEDRFNVCSGCGKNHDTDLNEALRDHGIAPVFPPIAHHPNLITPDDPGLTEDPNQPGFNMLGDRMVLCDSCHGDRYIPICEHPTGSHGQSGGSGVECPDPTRAPCPECRTPTWYTRDDLIDCPKTICVEGKLLPLEEPAVLCCESCGERYNINQFAPPKTD